MPKTNMQPGNIRHAPGVVCFVRVPEWAIENLNNSGKVCVITKEVFLGTRYTCGCGNTIFFRERLHTKDTLWEVSGNLFCGKSFGGVIVLQTSVPFRVFPQSWLIPISDPDSYEQLLESEGLDVDEIQGIEKFVEEVQTRSE